MSVAYRDLLDTITERIRGLQARAVNMRRFAALWSDREIVPTLSAQIGWFHHRVLLDAFADKPEPYAWYVAKASEQRWSVRNLIGWGAAKGGAPSSECRRATQCPC